jgi:hypothetical protein
MGMTWSIGWRASARLRSGLLWREATPTLADYPQTKTYAISLLLIALAWGWAMERDYVEQGRAAIERAARIDAEFTDCLRGEWRAVTEQGVEIGCMPVERNPWSKKK